MLDDTPANDNELHQVILTILKLIISEKWMSLLS